MSQEYNVLKTMQVREGNTPVYAHIIDDEKLGETTCSSKHVVDQFCQSFMESGPAVTCEPIEGCLLEVGWQTKNLCTTDTVELTSNDMKKVIWEGSISAPVVVSADFTGIEFASPNDSLFLCTVDGEIRYCSPKAVETKGYVITSGTLTEIRVLNWSKGTGTVKFQLEVGIEKTAYEPYAETATITRCGRNLFNYKEWVAYANSAHPSTSYPAREETEFLGRKCFSYHPFQSYKDLYFTNIRFKPNTQYTIKMQIAMTYASNTEYAVPAMLFLYTDGSSSYIPAANTTVYKDKFVEASVTSTAGKTISKISIPNFGSAAMLYIPIDSCVIEEGTTAEYSPYTGETFAPGEAILALDDVNNIYTDAGIVTVKGKTNFSATIKKLTNAILSLGGNV